MANKNLREFVLAISENIELGEDFNIEDIPEVELPENFNDDFHNNYLTMTAAKNNSELMKHFKGKYLSSADLKLKNSFIANGGTEEEFNELKAQEPDSLKLVEVVFDKVKERISSQQPSNDKNKELEKYKAETIAQFEEMKTALANKDADWESKLNTERANYEREIKTSKVNELLSGVKFDSSIPKEDLMLILNSKLDNSPYDIRRVEGQFKVYKKGDPDNALALNEGKEIQLEDVITEIAKPYTQKNDQSEPKPVRQVTVPTDSSSEDGRYIVGHKDYGKS